MCRAISGRLWAWFYDVAMRRVEQRGLAAIRHGIVSQARGHTLEIGAGTGANLAHYVPAAAPLVLTEPDPHKLRRLRHRARHTRPDAQTVSAQAQSLPFPDATFDTVVATLVLCSVPNQADALAELGRVLRPGGVLVFIEHVRSDEHHLARRQVRRPGGVLAFIKHVRSDEHRLARRQDRWRPAWRAVAGGCEPNRTTAAAIEAAGFELTELRHGRMPAGPSIVRPLAIGVATRRA